MNGNFVRIAELTEVKMLRRERTAASEERGAAL